MSTKAQILAELNAELSAVKSAISDIIATRSSNMSAAGRSKTHLDLQTLITERNRIEAKIRMVEDESDGIIVSEYIADPNNYPNA